MTNLAKSFILQFEDPIGLLRPEWRDYSKHQGYVDHGVARANGVQGMTARATISWGYQDPFFDLNWIGANLVGMYRNSYHVIYPGQPALRQMDNWYKVNPTIDIIPRTLDLELEHEQEHQRIADVTWEMSDIVHSRDGVRPIIYSRYLLINKWLQSWTDEMLNAHFYHLAQYKWDRTREHPGPPTLPARVQRKRIIMHQTADKKPGYPKEAQSFSVDYDRWEIGNETEMHQWIAENWGGPVSPPHRDDWYTDIHGFARASGYPPVNPLPPPAHTHGENE